MDSIELTVKMSIPFHIGQKVKAVFYEKFSENYEDKELEGTIIDIRIEYSLSKLKVETWLLVQASWGGKTFTKNIQPESIIVAV